jgi:hypothetical protein
VCCLLVVVGATTVSAAADPKMAEKVAAKTLELETKIDAIVAQTDSVIASLKSMTAVAPADRATAFKAYQKELDKTNKMYENAKKSAEAARKQRESYVKTWQKEAEKIQNPALKEASAARRAELTPMIEKIGGALQKAGADYVPMLQNLNDISSFLQMDLGAVTTPQVAELIQGAETTAASVKTDCETAKGGIRELSARLTGTGQ